MTNNTPIILDRLEAALAAHGVHLKRNQLLDVAAAAHGFRNANAFSAAAKNGEIDAAVPEALGTDDHGLTVLRDPVSGSVFAIDPLSPASRAAKWCLSPYGGLIDVSAMRQAERVAIKVHTATISHKHGTNFYVAMTAKALEAEIAGYCDEWWNDARDRDDDLPETTDGIGNAEIASLYFEAVDDEFVEIGTDDISVPQAIARALATPTGEAWAISRTDLESDEPVLWWSDADGWVDLASASVYPDDKGRLPTVGADEASVSWERLPTAYAVMGDRKADAATAADAAGWTPIDATPAEEVAIARVADEGIVAADRVTFRQLRVEGIPDDRCQGGVRKRVVLQTGEGFDAEATNAWSEAVSAVLARARATVRVAPTHAVVVFEGDADIAEAETPDGWMRAMADLLQPVADRERIMADFTPEAWIRDYAVQVDPAGETEIDVTYEMLLLGKDAASQLTSGDCDHLKEAVRVPAWIADWAGPFTIRVADAVEDSTLFD